MVTLPSGDNLAFDPYVPSYSIVTAYSFITFQPTLNTSFASVCFFCNLRMPYPHQTVYTLAGSSVSPTIPLQVGVQRTVYIASVISGLSCAPLQNFSFSLTQGLALWLFFVG